MQRTIFHSNYDIGLSTSSTHLKSTATITSIAMVSNRSTASAPTVVPTNPTAFNGPISYSNNNGLTTRTALVVAMTRNNHRILVFRQH